MVQVFVCLILISKARCSLPSLDSGCQLLTGENNLPHYHQVSFLSKIKQLVEHVLAGAFTPEEEAFPRWRRRYKYCIPTQMKIYVEYIAEWQLSTPLRPAPNPMIHRDTTTANTVVRWIGR